MASCRNVAPASWIERGKSLVYHETCHSLLMLKKKKQLYSLVIRSYADLGRGVFKIIKRPLYDAGLRS